jgi:chromosome condensin MukBEF ATPase and DNA-binding subunit MukB
MKFKNENDKFEWDVLELNEEEYIKKIRLLKPFYETNDSFFSFPNAREKWNNSTNKKRFKEKILNSLKILEKDSFEYSDVISIFVTLSSISTHIFIELEYYESNREQLKEFLKITELFLNKYNILLSDFKNIIINPNTLNNYKEVLEEIFEYFKDF